MQTTLNLLTPDGTVYMAFSPSLKADEYAELKLANDASDTAELRQEVKAWASRKAIRFSFDPAKEPA